MKEKFKWIWKAQNVTASSSCDCEFPSKRIGSMTAGLIGSERRLPAAAGRKTHRDWDWGDVSEHETCRQGSGLRHRGNADHHKALWKTTTTLPPSGANSSSIKKKDLLRDLAGSIGNGRWTIPGHGTKVCLGRASARPGKTIIQMTFRCY